MQPTSHIIGRQTIRLHYQGAGETLQLRQRISDCCTRLLPQKLEALLDQFDDKDHVLRLDKIAVRLSLDDLSDLENQLPDAIVAAVAQALREALEQQMATVLSPEKSLAETLKFYLEKGYLPWWAAGAQSEDFRQELFKNWQGTALENIADAVRYSFRFPDARRRFVALLPDEKMMERFILAAGFCSPEAWRDWQDLRTEITDLLKPKISKRKLEALWQDALLQSLPLGKNAAGSLPALLVVELKNAGFIVSTEQLQALWRQQKMIPEENASDEPGRPAEWPLPKTPGTEARIMVGNAGLVLLASFLPLFFKELHLLEGKELKDPDRAIALLRYLAFGHETFDEWEVPLEKILCGMPLNESVSRAPKISNKEKQEAAVLLLSVIAHWSVLKNTSPDGLRYNFLQREGRLLHTEESMELMVQKEPQDILLDFLPWSISRIKLPWMQRLLHVNWHQ